MPEAMLRNANDACIGLMFLPKTQPVRAVSQSCDVSNASTLSSQLLINPTV
jgi:hypothetical protein